MSKLTPLTGQTGSERPQSLSPPTAWHVGLVVLLVAVSLVPIWVTKHFPSQNGPWFLLPTHMFKEYHNPQRDYSEYYVRNWHPIPHMLHDVLVGLVSYVLPLLVAEKVVLSAYVLLLPASVFYFLSVVAPGKKLLGYLSFLMIYSYPFLRGYHDFTLSIPLFFFTLGFWMQHRDGLGRFQVFVLAAMATLVYLSHLMAFALLAGVIAWIRLWETRSLAKACKAALLVTWPGWLLFVDFLLLNSRATWLDRSDTSWLPFHWTVENFLRQFFHSVSFPAYVIAVLPWLWLIFFVVAALIASRGRLRQSLRAAACHPLVVLVGFLVVVYLLLPYKLLGWHKVNVRLVPFILVLIVGCVGQIPAVAQRRLTKLSFVVTVIAAVIGVGLLMTREVVRMDQALAEYLSGLDAFEPNSRLLAIHVENPAFGQIRPLTRAHEYFHIAKGGANGGSIPAMNTLSIMWYRTYPVEKTFPKFDPQSAEQSMQRIADAYDYILVWGTDGELAELLERSAFKPVHENGKLHLYRKQEAVGQSVAHGCAGGARTVRSGEFPASCQARARFAAEPL